MYNLPQYKDKDEKAVMQFIHDHPFAFITGCDAGGRPVATQIPVFIEKRDGRLYLTGHMMKGTDHHKAFEQNPHTLCVFTGHHTYVSASWYTNPNQGSTWNYMSVHARGTMRFLDDAGLEDVLRKTSLHFEKGEAESPTVFDNLPEDYRERLMNAILAFEVEVESLEHVFKLSQNRDQESYRHIIEKLEKGDDGAKGIAEEMRNREENLYG